MPECDFYRYLTHFYCACSKNKERFAAIFISVTFKKIKKTPLRQGI